MGDHSAPLPLAAAIERWRRLVGVAGPDAMGVVHAVWGDLVGSLATDVEPLTLREGVLVVAVADPAVAEAVRWRADGWVAELRPLLDGEPLDRIDVRRRRPERAR